jgi:ATP-dependent DNA helicase RecG
VQHLERVNATLNATVNLNKTEQSFMQMIRKDPSVTALEITEALGLHRITVIRNLNKLKEKGIIERIGSDKTRYWKIKSLE